MIRHLWHWMWRSSVRRQLIAGVALVHMLLMTLFVFDLVHRQHRFLHERAQKRVKSQAELLATNSLHGTLSLDLEGLAEIVDALATQRYVQHAMITDPGGRLLAHTDKDKIGLFRNDERTSEIVAGTPELVFVHEGDASIEAAAPILAHGRLVGWAWVTNDLTADQAYLARVMDAGLLYTVAAILVGTIFAVLLARTVTRPLSLLLAGTERLAHNQLDRPVPVTTDNEIGQFTHGFNEAMHRLLEQRSERERAEEALRRSEALYRTIARNIPNGGVWVIDRELRFLVGDGALLCPFGLQRGGLQGKTVDEIVDQDVLRVIEPRIRLALAGEVASYETEFNGRVIWAHYIPLGSEDGGVTAVMVLALDISERKRMELDLQSAKDVAEEASRAKSEFLANMSHELRTPMTVIMSCLEFLRQPGPVPDVGQFLEMAENAAHRLLGIIDDLLDISRIEAGRLKIDEGPFDLRDCVCRAVAMFALPAREKGLRLHWEVAPQVPGQVNGDCGRIGQVLVNLVGNAVKFTDRGEVVVAVTESAGGLEFTVRDTGIGIPGGKIDLLFEPFTQVDSSLTRRHGGTGLGLAICKELVELMGGAIHAESDEGVGSTFTFTVPLLRVQSASRTSSREIERGKRGRPVRILLAEDDRAVRDVVEMILRQHNWDVVSASNGREAVARWEEGGIDLVLMDLQMPEVNGLEATRTIKKLEAAGAGRTPIIAITAHVRPEDREECLSAGMDAFLAKPIRIGELGRTIERCLAGSGKIDASPAGAGSDTGRITSVAPGQVDPGLGPYPLHDVSG